MLGLAPIIAGICGSLFANSIAEKQRNSQKNVQPVQYIPAENPRNYRFAFSEETVCEKMGKIAERFKMKINYNKPYKQYEYSISLIGKQSFNVKITPNRISIATWFLEYYFVMFDDSMPHCKACSHMDFYEDEYEEVYAATTGFSSNISFNDLSNDEIFDIIEKIIEAIYGAKSMEYETIEADDGNESFIFYLDAPDYYGYSETTEIGNFKFILNKENGGNQNG